MTGPRLTDQLQLAFAPVDDGLSSAAVGEGAEPVVAKGEPERSVVTPSVMEAVCERENLKKALRRVKANKGSPGVDGMTGASVINCYSGGQKLFPARGAWRPARHHPRDRVDAY